MRTTFSRQLGLTAGMLLLSFLLLGCSFTSLFYNHMLKEEMVALSTNAQAVSEYLSTESSLSNVYNWDLRLSINYGAEVSDTDVLISDANGKITICTCEHLSCQHLGQYIPGGLLQNIDEDGSFYTAEGLEGIYDEARYLYGMPIYNTEDQLLGYALVSRETEDISDMTEKILGLFMITAIVILLIATMASAIIARKQTWTLRQLSQAARQFAHGDFSTRIDPQGADEEVAELAIAFNNMATELAKSEARRQEFISNVSHELKTPMTTIAGFMDGMLDGTIPKEKHAYYMQSVSNEVKRLSRMVRSMLDISRLQATGEEIKKTRFDVTETLGRTLLTFEQKIEEKQLDVQVDMPEKAVYVTANEDAITQVIYNLIDNGVKFATEGTPFLLTVSLSGSKALISVTDHGQTIPPDELSMVFDRFHKSDKSRSKDTSGVGLGLYIVKTILGSHGEDITVESHDDITTFTFTLSLAK